MINEKHISQFKSLTEIKTIVGEVSTIGSHLEWIQNGKWKEQVDKLRAGEDIKPFMRTVAFHGVFDGLRKKDKFVEASGLIILDIDDVEIDEIKETKEAIFEENDHVFAVMTSPSGNGIKVLYYVEPDLVNADNYRLIGKQLVSDFDIYGSVDYLSITDCLVVTYDPDILIREDVEPDNIYVPIEVVKQKGKLGELDDSKELWDDPEDFFDTVLANDIALKTNNNFHYIQVAVLDLKKFGFSHPAEDLSFVINYAENEFKHSGENKKRFLEAVDVSKSYDQLLYPYRIIHSDDPDDEYNDYSEYKEEKKEGEEEVELNGLIDYSTFLERVKEVVAEGDRIGFEVSLENFANIFRLAGTGILTVTGIPSHGKTEFVDQLIMDLARLYGHETIIAGFEQSPEQHVIKLIRKLLNVDVTHSTWWKDRNQELFKEAYNFTTDHIKHIDTTMSGGNINELLEISAKRIKESRDAGGDPKYIVLDPFNMLSIKGRFSGHEKIEEMLRRLTHFSHQMKVMVILVAHPFKMKKDDATGVYQVPDFYSVKGSSAFFEMSYHGLVVYRRNNNTTEVMVEVLKVKQNNMGTTGAQCNFSYEKQSGRYIPLDEEGNELEGDHRDDDWLERIKALSLKNK